MLADVRQRLLHHAVGERLEVLGDSLGARVPVNSVPIAVSCLEARERLAERRHQAALLQHRRPQARHQPAQGVGLAGELLADLRQDLDAALDRRRP